MTGLVESIRAQLDEDERIAVDAKDERSGVWTHVGAAAGHNKVIDDLGYSLTEHGDVDSQPWWTNPHIARHDPARVLAEVKATREILADHTTPHTVGADGFCVEEGGECTHAGESWCSWHGTDDCATVRSLAASLGIEQRG